MALQDSSAHLRHFRDDILKEKKGETLSPEEVIEMDWLAENIIGRIPKIEELQEQAKPVLTQQGIETRKG